MFQGGKLRHFTSEWEKVTSDNWILQTICGYKLEITFSPWQPFKPNPIQFNQMEQKQIDDEISKFLDKKIIEKVETIDKHEYYSNIFMRPKKDGTVRVILNLKRFNDCVEKIHFKMETLKSAIANIQPGDFFGSIDVKDAYFSIPIAESDRKYLRFIWNNKRYQFVLYLKVWLEARGYLPKF